MSCTDTRKQRRPSRSFIWEYCTKEDSKHARCHLCNKVLCFGGANTSNISKHLQRKHKQLIEDLKKERADTTLDEDDSTSASEDTSDDSLIELDPPKKRKARKKYSYVWDYCDKLTRYTICCKLCSKVMSFHGTANIIIHLQRKHNIVERVDKEEKISCQTMTPFNSDGV